MNPFWLVVVIGLIFSAGQVPEVEPLSFDSAARAVGEVARALGGQGRGLTEPYPEAAQPFLFLLRHVPPSLRQAVIHWGMSFSLGYPMEALNQFDLEDFFSAYTRRYPSGQYPAIVLGSPGGGVAHLAALLDAPFLPACGLVGARHKIHPDDLAAYLTTADEAARRLGPTEGFELIVHYDPIHDRDLVARAALVRVRLLSLPKSYREFIRQNLAPGGVLIVAECTYPWPQIKLGPNCFLQIGGLGGIVPEEYLAKYPWPGVVRERRESEWGCPEELVQDLREFAKASGIRILEILGGHPEDYSLLAYRAYRAAGAREDVVLFDCFTTMDARFCKRTGIPPLHLPFGTRDALAFAQEFALAHPGIRKLLLLHPTFAAPPDWAELGEWREALGEGLILLVDEPYWPGDPYAPFALAGRLSELEREWSLPVPLSLSLEELLKLLSEPSSSAGRMARGP